MNAQATADEGPTGQLDREAARWCSVMHGPDAQRQREAFEAWLRRGALHRQAYNRMEEVFLLGAKLPPRMLADSRAQRGRRWPQLVAGGIAFAAIVLVSGAWSRWRSPPGPVPDVEIADGVSHLQLATMRISGETFRLSDGSQVTLGPDSEMSVDYGARQRLLRLMRGRSHFIVRPHPAPFVVEARGSRITTQGSEFDVAILRPSAVRVAVRSGSVALETRDLRTGDGSRQRLDAGQSLDFSVSPSTAVEAADPTAGSMRPPQPRTVADLIDQANAATRDGRTIEVVDRSILAIPLGGDFEAHDPNTAAQRLAMLVGLVIEERRGKLVLRRRSATAR